VVISWPLMVNGSSPLSAATRLGEVIVSLPEPGELKVIVKSLPRTVPSARSPALNVYCARRRRRGGDTTKLLLTDHVNVTVPRKLPSSLLSSSRAETFAATGVPVVPSGQQSRNSPVAVAAWGGRCRRAPREEANPGAH